MTDGELSAAIGDYGVGLEAELTLLRQFHHLALQQKDATARADYSLLARIADDRQRLMESLLTIDAEIRPMRETLADHRTQASQLPGFADVSTLHRIASELVTFILGADRETLEALQKADLTRRVAAQAIETGENTLAAYRRVIAPAQSAPALVDRRG